MSQFNNQPVVFHITHWKAGSQWLHKILRHMAPERIIAPQVDERQFLDMPLVDEAIYPTVYVTRDQFFSVALPDNYKKFVVIRDLRDTLVSGYFSIRYSHAAIDERLVRWREILNKQNVEEGLLMLMQEWLPMSSKIQESWIDAGEKFIRYEDLLSNDCEILIDLLISHCQMPVTTERLREIVILNRFENLTGGRKTGEEDFMAHERKGIAGDWQNYFTPRVTEKFNEQYGHLLLRSGYGKTHAGSVQ